MQCSLLSADYSWVLFRTGTTGAHHSVDCFTCSMTPLFSILCSFSFTLSNTVKGVTGMEDQLPTDVELSQLCAYLVKYEPMSCLRCLLTDDYWVINILCDLD